jgi:hypothetical protein
MTDDADNEGKPRPLPAKGVSVNVQANNQTNLAQTIRPGYVLDLSALKDKPRTPDADPLTIDAHD